MRQIIATSKDGGHPCCQSCHMPVDFSLQSHNSLLHSSVQIHAARGGGLPRWQPLHVAVAMTYWRDANQRQIVLAGCGIKLRHGGAHLQLKTAYSGNGGADLVFDSDGILIM